MESAGKPTELSQRPAAEASTSALPLPGFAVAATRAIVVHLFDTGAGLPQDRLTWLLDDVADFTGRAGKKTRAFFLLAVLLLEWAFPLLFLRRPRRFSKLSHDAQLLCLERAEASGLSGLLLLIKAVLGLVYFEHPEALDEIGYDRLPLLPSAGGTER